MHPYSAKCKAAAFGTLKLFMVKRCFGLVGGFGKRTAVQQLNRATRSDNFVVVANYRAKVCKTV